MLKVYQKLQANTEERKLSSLIKAPINSAECNSIKQVTITHVENETKTEHLNSFEKVNAANLLSLPYSPTLLYKDKMNSAHKSPLIKKVKLLELTTFEFHRIKQETQVPSISVAIDNSVKSHHKYDVELKEEGNLLGN